MEELSHHAMHAKKRKQGPKKDFLSRLSVDSDSGSDLSSADRCSLSVGSNQSARSQSISGQSSESQSARFMSVDGYSQLASLENQSARSWYISGNNQSGRSMSVDGQSDSLTLSRSNQTVINQSIDQNNKSTRKQFIDQQSNGDYQSAKVHYKGRSDQSVESQTREDHRQFLSGNYQIARGQSTGENNDCVRHHHTGQNQSVINNPQNRNNQFTRNKSLISQNQSESSESGDSLSKSSLDVLASVAAPKRQKADSLSLMSLPEDLRFSFSEIEDGSIQLDDIDLTCSPNADDTNSSGMDQNKCLVDDRDLQRISALISSSSDQNEAQKMEATALSESYMKEGASSARRDRDVVKSENSGDNAGVTWDDILSWGVNAHQESTVGSSGEVLSKKKTISPRRSSKNKHMENVSCQVCGDVAAGFYCGAFICEACKKFYMRAYKQDKLKYVCLRDKKCVITKESRVQCQYCRFQKCVGLHMYIPKQGEGEMNDSQMSHIPCRVCLAPSSGFHFGAITCEGCKGFFRRMAKEREPEKYQCNKQQNCEINMVTRNLCKACRYRSCLRAGMSVEGSRIGRQPNSVKHAISMELKMVKPDPCDADIAITKVKEEPIDSDVDFLQDADKSDEFTFWNTENIVTHNQISKQGSSSDNSLISSPGAPPVNQSCFDSITRSDTSVIPEEILTISESSQQALSLTHMPQVTSENCIGKANIGQQSFVSKGDQMMNTPPCVSVGGSSGRQAIIHQPQMSMGGSNRGLATTPQPRMSMVGSNQGLTLNPQLRVSMGGSAGELTATPQPHMSMGASNVGLTTIPQPRVSMGGSDGGLTTIPQPRVSIGGSKWGLSTIPQRHFSEVKEGSTTNVFTFTPSPVTQFLSSTPAIQKTTETNSGRQLRDTTMNLNGPQAVNSVKAESVSQHAQYSPSMPAPQMNATNQLNLPLLAEADQDMKEAVEKIIEAGKCLQLLNYRVFDTDVNPTTSMNVDDIKALFKSKYMDPRAGNNITSKVDMSIFSSRESTWNYMMTNFHHNTYITIRFAKLVPGFSTLSLNDRVKLIQSSIYPIELLNMSKVYDASTKKYNYFTYTKEEENVMMEQFPMLRVFQEHFLHIGEMVTSFQFTDEEFAILSALLLFPAEISGLEDPKAVERLQFHISAALQFYEEGRFVDGLTRYGILLVRVAELVQCLLQHNLAIGLLLTHNPSIKVPQLFHELIIESIKEEQKT